MDGRPPRTIPRAARGAQITAKITPEIALSVAMSAWENASQLLEGAVTLHAKGNNGPARSLANSAREEIGKFFAAMMYCMGVLPADRFAETFWNHSSKQALGAVLAMLGGP